MAADPTTVHDILESIADGASSEDVAARAARLEGPDRRLQGHLRLVAGIADIHRTFQAEEEITTASPARTRRAGDRWGNVELTARVGSGAFGEVWRGRDLHLNNDVALKLLHARVNDD